MKHVKSGSSVRKERRKMDNINQTIILRGYVAKEVKVYSHYIGKNGETCNVGQLTLGVNNSTENSDFLPITLFGQQCNLIEKYCRVGTQLLLGCSLKNNIYTKKSGKDIIYCGGVQIIAENFQVLSQPNKKRDKKGEDA